MSTYRSILSLLCSYGLLLVANGLFSTIVSIRSKTEDFPENIIGLVLAGYFAGLLLSSFYAVRIVAAVGHIRAFALFASIASAVAVAHLLIVGPVSWGLFRLVSGFCMGGMIVVTEGWLNERADNKNRGKVMSVYMITTYACAGSAQLMMMVGNPDGFELFVIVSILYSFALAPILMTQSKAPVIPQPHIPSPRRLYALSPVGTVGSFVVGYVNGIFYALSPVYAYSLGLSTKQTAIFIALAIMSGMLLQLPLGKLSDKIDRRWVIILSSILTSVACYFLYVAHVDNLLSLYLAAVFYGSVAFSINPVCVAHVNDLAPKDERTQTAGGLLMFYGVGAVIGPVMAGFILPFGEEYIYLMSGFLTFVLALYTSIRLLVKPRHNLKKRQFKAFSVLSPARRLGVSHDSDRAEKK